MAFCLAEEEDKTGCETYIRYLKTNLNYFIDKYAEQNTLLLKKEKTIQVLQKEIIKLSQMAEPSLEN